MKAAPSKSVADPGSEILLQRGRRIAHAVITAVASRGTALIVSALSVPLAVPYLGAELYGVWMTITGTLTMLLVMDLGIANTLTNLISKAYAEEDKESAGHYSATAFWTLTGLAVLLATIFCAALPYLDLAAWMGIHQGASVEQTRQAVLAAVLIFLAGLPLGLGAKLLGGYQQLSVSNYFLAAGNLCSLLCIWVVVKAGGGLPLLIAVTAGSTALANLACLIWIYLAKPWLRPSPKRFQKRNLREILGSGSAFFAVQLSGLVVFNSNNLVIAHFISPGEVTPYSVTWRLVSYAAALQSMMTPALWPAYSEAYARGDSRWILSTYKKITALTVTACAVLLVVLVAAGRWVIEHWAGPAAVPSRMLLSLMGVWMVLCALTTNQATLLLALNKVRSQAWISMTAAAVNLLGALFLVRHLGSSGVILSTILSYVLIIMTMQSWSVARLIRELRTSI